MTHARLPRDRGGRWLQSAIKACLAVWLLMVASFAFAHASLLDTQPADGTLMAQAPRDVLLRFNEPVAPLVFKLLLPDGSSVALSSIGARQDGIRVVLPAQPLPGTYLLSWRVVSEDGHPVGGALAYSIGTRSATTAAPARMPPALRTGIWLSRLSLYVALFAGVGAVLFRAFAHAVTPPPQRFAMAFLVVGMAIVPMSVAMHGLDALAAPWASVLTVQPWRTSLGTSYGATACLMLASLVVAAFAGRMQGRAVKPAAVAAALLLAAALGASGHASSAPPRWLARPAVFIHALAITAWIGSLLPLLLALHGRQGTRVLSRFSRAVPWVLLLLVISGTALAVLQLDGWQSLWRSDYGRILSAKLALVLVLLGVAAINRYLLTGRFMRGDASARQWMWRLIGVELLLVLGVLALATTWRFTPPPRALAVAQPRIVSIHMHGAQAMVDLTLTPQPESRWRADLVVTAISPVADAAKEVALELSNPALGTETLRRTAVRQADGTWVVEPFALPVGGRWHVRVDVLISDFEQARLDEDVRLGE